jgi:hypothetical protein
MLSTDFTDHTDGRGSCYPQISVMTQIVVDVVATSSSPVRSIAGAMRALLGRNRAQLGSEL